MVATASDLTRIADALERIEGLLFRLIPADRPDGAVLTHAARSQLIAQQAGLPTTWDFHQLLVQALAPFSQREIIGFFKAAHAKAASENLSLQAAIEDGLLDLPDATSLPEQLATMTQERDQLLQEIAGLRAQVKPAAKLSADDILLGGGNPYGLTEDADD